MPNNSLLSDEILELQRKKKRDEAFYKHESEAKIAKEKYDKERQKPHEPEDDYLYEPQDNSEALYLSQFS